MQREDSLARSMSFRVSTGAVQSKSSLDIVGNDQRQIHDFMDPEEIFKGGDANSQYGSAE